MVTCSSCTSLLFPLLFIALAMSAHAAAPVEVRDIAGKQVQSGVDYYILPVTHRSGGGLTLGPNRMGTCPLNVVQEQHLKGLPLTFLPVNPKKGVIRVSTDLNIKFSAASICVQTTLWKLAKYDETVKKYFVSTGGEEGNPGPATLSNWFKIERYEDNYKLVYCPTVCRFCKVICKDIGIYADNGVRRLALTDGKPFKVKFQKA